MGLATTSCDSYLDINQNPNSPQESDLTPSILFPAAEMSLTASYGDLFRIPAGYHAQQFAQEFDEQEKQHRKQKSPQIIIELTKNEPQFDKSKQSFP